MMSLSLLAGRTEVDSKLLSVLLQYSLNTVNPEIFARILFSQIALKDILVMLKT